MVCKFLRVFFSSLAVLKIESKILTHDKKTKMEKESQYRRRKKTLKNNQNKNG